jgi:hypothetical protein
MLRLILALSLIPALAFAETPPQPTPLEIAQAGSATAADLANLVVALRAQLLADQREIGALTKATAAARTPTVKPDQDAAH